MVPDIADGIRQKFGRDCTTEICEDLVNIGADLVASPEASGPVGYAQDTLDGIKDAFGGLRDRVARGGEKLANVDFGLSPRDQMATVNNSIPASPIGPPTVSGSLSGTTTGPQGGVTQVTGTINTSGNFNVSGPNVTISGNFNNGVVTGGNFQVGTTQGMVSSRIRPPVVTRDIPEQTLIEGKALTLNLSSYFTHPDGLALTYEVTCSSITATTTPQVSVSQTGQLTLLPDTVGASTCTAWAYPLQERLWRVSSTFLTKVAPSTTIPPPVVDQVIPDQSLPVGEGLTLNLTSYFSHPDGLELHFDTASSDDAIATADVIVDLLLLQAWEVGTLSITVSASVGNGPSTNQNFSLTVTPFTPTDPAQTAPLCYQSGQTVTRYNYTPEGCQPPFEPYTRESCSLSATPGGWPPCPQYDGGFCSRCCTAPPGPDELQIPCP